MTLKTLIPQDMSKAVLLIVLKVFKGLNFPCSNWICLQFFAWQKQRNLKTIVITHRYFDHHHDSLYQPLSWKNPDQQDDYPDPDLDQWPGLEKGSSSQSSGKCSCWQPEEKNSSEHCQIQGGESAPGTKLIMIVKNIWKMIKIAGIVWKWRQASHHGAKKYIKT